MDDDDAISKDGKRVFQFFGIARWSRTQTSGGDSVDSELKNLTDTMVEFEVG